MKKRMALMLLIVGLVFAGLLGFNMFKGVMIKKMMAGMANQIETVSTTVVVSQEWQPKLESAGSLIAVKGADLATEASGIVESVHFTSGNDVKSGEILVRLRSQDDEAKLQSLIASEKLAEITLERDRKQFEVQAVSQATIDADEATYASAKAAREAQQAEVIKKTIKAPFAGRTGVRLFNEGQYVTAGSTIVTLQQLDPIQANFYLPEQNLSLIKTGQKVDLASETYPNETFTGTITAIDPKVSTDTRNVLVQATFKNPKGLLVPGMFADISVLAGKVEHNLTLPQTAITYNPYGNTVYVVDRKKDDKGADVMSVRQTFVATGATRGDQIVVLSGIKEGDEVVSTGQQKLRNGSLIAINNEIQPTNDIDPKPVEK